MAKKSRNKSNAKKGALVPVSKNTTRLGAALRALGGLGGGALGGMIGQNATGAALGTNIGAALSRWLGSGSYKISRNSILTSSSSIPVMHMTGQSVVIRHREYLGPIISSTNFNVQYSYTLNPGIAATFPWLSNIANSFQEYEIKGMVFHYIPTSGDAIASTNNALGSVIIQTTYRANDSPPSSKIAMLNEYYACEAKPSEAFAHPIECDPKENPFNVHYVRSLAIPSNDSPLMYDMGMTWIATSGQQAANVTLGDLWITYEIEFKKPIVFSNVTTPLFPSVSRSLFTSPVSASQLFTNNTTTQGNLPVTFLNATNTLQLLPGTVGTYKCLIEIASGAGFTTFNMSATSTLTNCNPANENSLLGVGAGTYWSNTQYDTGVVNNPSSTTLSRGFYVIEAICTASLLPPTILFPTPTVIGTISTVSVTVVRVA